MVWILKGDLLFLYLARDSLLGSMCEIPPNHRFYRLPALIIYQMNPYNLSNEHNDPPLKNVPQLAEIEIENEAEFRLWKGKLAISSYR